MTPSDWIKVLRALRLKIGVTVELEQRTNICSVCQRLESDTTRCNRADCPKASNLPTWLEEIEPKPRNGRGAKE